MTRSPGFDTLQGGVIEQAPGAASLIERRLPQRESATADRTSIHIAHDWIRP